MKLQKIVDFTFKSMRLLYVCLFVLLLPAFSAGQQPVPTGAQETGRTPDTCILRNEDGSCAALDREKLESPTPPVITNRATEDNSKLAPAPTRPKMPPPELTEFQKFVLGSTERTLPMFGHALFTDVPTTFSPVQQLPVTSDYVVGPEDEILVRAWGQVEINYAARVDRTGAIYIPKVGSIQVAGLRFDQLQPTIEAAIGKIFRNFTLTVTLGRLRSIQVFVVGQALRPGAYTVSSMSTLLNAVFAAGGPASQGSVRNIQLKRGDRVVTDFDLYDLLIKGDKSKDSRLLPGDVIFFPPAGALMAINGSVNVPAIYELKSPTTVGDAVAMAGGLTSTASTRRATLERIEERNVRRIEEFPLDAEGMARAVRDGDLLTVIAVSPKFDNAVTLRGNVEWPGRYPWHSGMRIRDLIPSREALVTRQFWQNQNQILQDPADKAGKQDQRARPEAESPADDAGAKKDAVPKKVLNASQLQIDVRRSAPEINWDYALIQRLNVDDLSTTLIPFNLRAAIIQNDESQNILLAPGDIITIFSQADITVPTSAQTKFVRLEGEFTAAGVYRVAPGQTLRQLIMASGGLTNDAYLFGAAFTRESTRQAQQARYQEFIDSLEKAIERNTASATSTVSSPENAAVLKDQIDSQRRLVQKLRAVQVKGQIVLELSPRARDVSELPDLALEDGDRFIVPSRPLEVNVFGAVYNESAFLYRSEKRLSDYLREAGGPRKGADARDIFVIRANGSVVSRNSTSGFFRRNIYQLNVMPGDTIVVPEQLNKFGFVRGLKDFAQIISQFALGAASIRVISRP